MSFKIGTDTLHRQLFYLLCHLLGHTAVSDTDGGGVGSGFVQHTVDHHRAAEACQWFGVPHTVVIDQIGLRNAVIQQREDGIVPRR